MLKVFSETQKYWLYRGVLSVASGMSLASAFAPEHMPLCTLAALVVLFYMVAQTNRVWEAGVWGWLFGFGWFASGINWVYYSMYHYGYMPMEWSCVTTVVLSLALGLFPAVAMMAATWITPDAKWRMALALPAAFTLTEWLRGWLLTGFPWLNPAYSIVDWDLAGIAPFMGVYGVLLALVWIAGLIGALWVWYGNGQWVYMASAALMIVTIVMFGMIGKTVQWTTPAGELAVRMVQPNFEPRMVKESLSERFDQAYSYLESVDTNKFKPDVVMLPESVFPTSVQRFPAHQWARLNYWAQTNETSLLFNAFWEPKFDDFANAAVYLEPNGQLTVYEKRHLVPFGEFVPYGFQWYIDSMRIPMSSLRAGSDNQPLMKMKGYDVSVNICYENLFGEEWIEVWQTGSPQLLVNLSNLKWFGPLRAAAQHLQISQMRALEVARPLLNVTNSGQTALVNERGQIVHALPTDATGILDIKVPVVNGEATPYVKMGNWPAILWALAMLVIGFVTTLVTKRSKINKFDA